MTYASSSASTSDRWRGRRCSRRAIAFGPATTTRASGARSPPRATRRWSARPRRRSPPACTRRGPRAVGSRGRYAPPAFITASWRRPAPAERSSRRATRVVRPHAHAPQAVRQAVARASSSAVGQRAVRRHHGHGVRRARGLRGARARCTGTAAYSARLGVPRLHPRRSSSADHGQCGEARRGPPRRRPAAGEVLRHPLARSRGRTGRRRTRRRRAARRRRPRTASPRSTLAVATSGSDRSSRSPAKPPADAPPACSVNIDLEEGGGRGSARPCSSSTSRSKGTSWCANASSAPRARGSSSSAEGRVAGHVRPQGQGVDEDADQPLRLRGVRPAMGVPTTTSSCPGPAPGRA